MNTLSDLQKELAIINRRLEGNAWTNGDASKLKSKPVRKSYRDAIARKPVLLAEIKALEGGSTRPTLSADWPI
jgi:hypothetical protein